MNATKAFLLSLLLLPALALAQDAKPKSDDDWFRGKLFPPELVLKHASQLKLSDAQRKTIRSELTTVQTRVATVDWDIMEAGLAMQEAIEVADRHDVPASQFELLTAGAVKLLADEGVKWAVLEAGLGARHDATSAVAPEAVVLTNVGLDHAEYLGGTVEEVSREKLASVSPGSRLSSSDASRSATMSSIPAPSARKMLTQPISSITARSRSASAPRSMPSSGT